MYKPKVFVASSSEGLEVANVLQLLLQKEVELTIWTQEFFGLGSGTLETLVDQAADFDFGIVVFAPDDRVSIRGAEQPAPRDNTVFELGLLMGSIGRKRAMIVACDTPDLRLPSDLAGITTTRYSGNRSDSNLVADLGPAATQIRHHIKSVGRRDELSTPPSIRGAVLCRGRVSLPKAYRQ